MWGTQLLCQFLWSDFVDKRWARAVFVAVPTCNPRVHPPKTHRGVTSPRPPEGKRAKTHTMQDEGYAPFQDPFLTLYFVQFASFAHFFCCIVLPYAPSTSMQVSGTYGQRLLFSIFAQPKRTCRIDYSDLRPPPEPGNFSVTAQAGRRR